MTAIKRSTHKSSTDLHKSSVNVAGDFQTERFLHLRAKLKVLEEIETDQESSASSSEDMESPRSVFSKVRKWPAKNLSVRVHSQILRIREEDSLLGEDVFREYCLISSDAGRDVDVVHFSKHAALPASPLGGRRNIN